jgi:type I restriction enzyme S subunit
MKTKINNSSNQNPQPELPPSWKWERLREVIQEIQPGFACGKRDETCGYIQLRMNNISSRCKIDLSTILRVPATQNQVNKYRLQSGDVIFNNTNSVELVGKTALFTEENGFFLYSNHLSRLRTITGVLNPIYFTLWLQLLWYRRVFEMICNRWIGQAAVQREKLLNLEIPLPPISEQKRIASKIQELQQEIDNARTSCEKQLEAVKALPSAYLREVFESEEAKKWERKNFNECIIKGKGLQLKGILQKEYKESGKYPIIDQGKDLICGYTDDQINIYKEELPVIIFGDHTRIFKYINFPFAIGADGTKVLIPNKNIILTKYFYYALSSFKIRNLGYSRHYKLLKKLDIPIPLLTVQQYIVDVLKEKMSEVEKLRTSIEKQLEAINALPQTILRKAFRGEL